MKHVRPITPIIDHIKCSQIFLVATRLLLANNFGMPFNQSVQGGTVVPFLEEGGLFRHINTQVFLKVFSYRIPRLIEHGRW